ncbi:carbonic anhydrase [Campylobacter sp. RM16192]|uniref:carbonic anhydrase n=1 Tax=Campylobacter sp. RM16192 TaxID=1660080 RepID=UPI001451E2C1|nr:carbonic anhydrase [Campylobacter sp. RM16192]QCD51777.1 carbonic anhydrase, beta class [Campylobacter sp. RM16192]
MESLLSGAIKFMEEDFVAHKTLFESLSDKQIPHTLFVGCIDSRVVPNLITNTLPGDLVVVRNIANIIPPYRRSEEYLATTSAIEYALQSLKVENVIICGHSNCGGCAALYLEESKFENIPNVKRWLDLLGHIKKDVEVATRNNPAKREWLTERLNVVNSFQNLLTYPDVKAKFRDGSLKIYAWHYIIETGEIYNYNPVSKTFRLLGVDK